MFALSNVAILEGFICHWERGELWKVGEPWAGKAGKVCDWSELARGESWRKSEVAQSERWEGSVVARQERWESIGGKVGDSLFYSRVGDAGWDQDFIFLFLMLINEMKEHNVYKRHFCVIAGTERFSLDLMQAVKNLWGTFLFVCVVSDLILIVVK